MVFVISYITQKCTLIPQDFGGLMLAGGKRLSTTEADSVVGVFFKNTFLHIFIYNNVSDGVLFLKKVPKNLQVGSVGKKM